jgi:hypothetical protein
MDYVALYHKTKTGKENTVKDVIVIVWLAAHQIKILVHLVLRTTLFIQLIKVVMVYVVIFINFSMVQIVLTVILHVELAPDQTQLIAWLVVMKIWISIFP